MIVSQSKLSCMIIVLYRIVHVSYHYCNFCQFSNQERQLVDRYRITFLCFITLH